MLKRITLILCLCFAITKTFSQAHAFDLIICNSVNGTTWTNNTLFQDSSGVPSVTQHSSGVIYCAFQWFPAPQSPTNTAHDKIAIKSSADGGLTWGSPTLAVFTGSPSGYKRPFDPTLVIADNGNIRMYFSSSKTATLLSLDSTVHCYSAISSDGINYTWEPGVRVLVQDSITIDPAVIKIGSVWHYTCPRGAPQHGAHHFISNDGLAWTRTTTIPSDFSHNYTGNLMSELPGGGSGYKFYGTPNPQTAAIWYKTTTDGNTWGSSFQNCTGPITSSGIQADPAVLKTGANSYLMIYVSKASVISSINKENALDPNFILFPNPSTNSFSLDTDKSITIREMIVYDVFGKQELKIITPTSPVEHQLPTGIHLIELHTNVGNYYKKLIVE